MGREGLFSTLLLARGRAVVLEVIPRAVRWRTTEAIVVWKSATETAAWKILTTLSCRVCLQSARIRFMGPDRAAGPGSTFSPALFYVGNGQE